MKKIILIIVLVFFGCNKKPKEKSLTSKTQPALEGAVASADTVSYDKVNIYLGSQVPNFIAQDENGDNQEFYDLKDKKNLILVFFRGYW